MFSWLRLSSLESGNSGPWLSQTAGCCSGPAPQWQDPATPTGVWDLWHLTRCPDKCPLSGRPAACPSSGSLPLLHHTCPPIMLASPQLFTQCACCRSHPRASPSHAGLPTVVHSICLLHHSCSPSILASRRSSTKRACCRSPPRASPSQATLNTGVGALSGPPPTGRSDLLLRFFESQFFDEWIALTCALC